MKLLGEHGRHVKGCAFVHEQLAALPYPRGPPILSNHTQFTHILKSADSEEHGYTYTLVADSAKARRT